MKAGFTPEYLLNADYYKEILMKGCMLGQHELEVNESIALNPFLKKK